MERKLLIIMIITLMVSVTGQAREVNQNFSETVSAYGEANGNSINIFVIVHSDGYSYVMVNGYQEGYSFRCSGSSIEDPVNVNRAANQGTAKIDTSELTCSGLPPALVSAECFANGRYSDQGVSNVKKRYGWNGITYKMHENFMSNSANCTIKADNVLYDNNNDNGRLRSAHYVDK
jgi:hypothetical protein